MSPWVNGPEFEKLDEAEKQLPIVQAALEQAQTRITYLESEVDRWKGWSDAADNRYSEASNVNLDLQRTIADQDITIAALRLNASIAAAAEETEAQLRAELDGIHTGDLARTEAQTQFEQAAIDRANKKVTERVTEQLIEERAAKKLAQIEAKDGPRILAEMDRYLENSGRYAEIDEEVAEAYPVSVHDKLVANRIAQATAQLSTPEYEANYLKEHVDEINNDPRVRAAVETEEAKLRPLWEEQGLQDAKDRALAALYAQEPDIRKQADEDFSESASGRRQIQDAEQKGRQEVKHMTIRDVIIAAGNAAHVAALAERDELEGQKILQQNAIEKLTSQFSNGGIDTTNIEKGTVLDIELGEVSTKYEDRYVSGNYRKTPVRSLVIKRTIKVTSLGDGTFSIDDDSLRRSSKHAALQAATEGLVVTLGTLLDKSDGKGGTQPHLNPVLKAGVRLRYDADPTDKHVFTDTLYDIANVKINGVPAIEYDNVNEKLE